MPEDEDSIRMEKPRSIFPSIMTTTTSQVNVAAPKTKHVSFARSQTLTSFEVPLRSKSPPRPHTQERLIDSRPTPPGAVSAALPLTQPEPRVLVLGIYIKLLLLIKILLLRFCGTYVDKLKIYV